MNPEQLKAAFEEFKAAQISAHEALKALVKEQEKGSKEGLAVAVAVAEKAAKDVQICADKLVAMEQRLTANILAGQEAPKSFGRILVEDPAYKAFASGQTNKCRITLKNGFIVRNNTITGQSGSPAANSDTLVPADRRPGIIPGAFRALRVRDLLASGNTVSNAVEFTRELAFTNNAAETAEGGSKPESVLTFELYSAPVVTIAHWIKVSRQILNDAPALVAYIENRLRYGVELREETQIVAGNGVGQNLIGMTVSPNFTAFTPTSGDTAIDSANRAIRALDAADYPANGIIMNPATWGAIERLKDENLGYLVGSPFGAIVPTLWGKPIALTSSMTANKLLVAAFDIAFMYLTREDTVVEMSESDDTNFQQNLITIRAEKRGVLGGLRPASVRYGNLTV
ncbi:MAG: phage major capsid protein [Candidatus Omnitrophica bacterium]|nr:phage major capsid protein [Candidatus Omnitrophota bacterium]